MHDLRHTFAVHCLQCWLREGKGLQDVRSRSNGSSDAYELRCEFVDVVGSGDGAGFQVNLTISVFLIPLHAWPCSPSAEAHELEL
jgi:hypothetical protein